MIDTKSRENQFSRRWLVKASDWSPLAFHGKVISM